jgi:2-succinyl-5-enolpyruvyl-6-hydroxy-3-cyclohexene-1-carboxylate synthase
MANYQTIYNIAEICAQKGLQDAILCPGSRCAPLTLAFANHPQIKTRTFTDERSAGFIAMGIAQQKQSPTVLICTSGSAAYNFSPAVAEAFFSETPLLIITADRPAEWIAQHDGQTIYQDGLYGKHVKKSYTLPQDYEHPDSQWAVNRMVNEAINLSFQEPKGPVHINAPFREPFYPASSDDVTFSENVTIIDAFPSAYGLTSEQKQIIASQWEKFSNVLLVAGQLPFDKEIHQRIDDLQNEQHIPVIGDIISNLHPIEQVINQADVFLGHATDEVKQSLQPDLLITIGQSTISKNLKLFLRKYPSIEHWHIQPAGIATDPYQQVSKVFYAHVADFIQYLTTLPKKPSFEEQKQDNFFRLWNAEARKTERIIHDFFPQEQLSEIEVVKEVMRNLPEHATLHLANSMSVRYANIIGLLPRQQNIKVVANRGTSGIDGCTSSAVGHALANSGPQVLITGDLAFFYDRNAFWHNYPIDNLHILLLNNQGGSIFKLLDGVSNLREQDEYFVTKQTLQARKLAEEFGIEYLLLDNKRKFKNLIQDFVNFDGKTKILEYSSNADLSIGVYKSLKQKIKGSYES